MKNKKSIFIVLLIVLVLAIGGVITYQILHDENKLTSNEKKWINENINTVQNINVVNNLNIFGSTGTGVYYEFINDLETKYNLQINPVTYNYGEAVSGLTLGAKTSLGKNDFTFYTDHYVLVSKTDEVITSYQSYANKNIGVANSDLYLVNSALKEVSSLSLISFETSEELLGAFDTNEEINYMIVPLTIYLDTILKNDYIIIDHLSDVKLYYTISGEDSTLKSILTKFYHDWSENLDAYFKREEFSLFISALNISEASIDAMQGITYNYGFINNSPYEVIMSGNYGGIVAMYLNEFSNFSNVEFNYTKYRSLDKFKKDISRGNVDLYFNYYDLKDNYYTFDSDIVLEYTVIANISSDLVVNSLNSLAGEEVYVQENSLLYTYLSNVSGITLKTYENESDLKKLNKKDVIIVIDSNIFNLYRGSNLSNYSSRYNGTFNTNYNFKTKDNTSMYKILSKYTMTLDSKEMIYNGMYNHSLTVKTGNILGTIAKYILILVVALAIIFIIVYRSSKKIKIAKKIKKENKMKFIDQLTSLKNRNYLNEYINNWNNNTVYPQTMIVIDLNNIQFINDTLGYEEGDKQIKAAANILIKTQLDNSDIMRTDGNEFLIYLVGYTQKHVTNYIHKLNKEFKKLPYEYGAEFGYSMINDNIKTIEDAILEATDEMKKQKKKTEEEGE